MSEGIKTLYHYTDFNAMRGIIVKGEIWLWNLRRMNDLREMDYFIERLKCALQKQVGQEYFSRIDTLFNVHLKDFKEISSFAACFSEYSDDAAQWARYAKGGLGVCVAFNKDILDEIGKEAHVPLYKVNYSQDITDLDIVHKIAQIIKTNDLSKQDSQLDQIFYNLITNSPLFKHPSFISEKEYRLVAHPFDVEKDLGKPNFYVEETNIKKYYILNLKAVCKNLKIRYTDLFDEICIGPQARVTKEMLSDYFEYSDVGERCTKIKLSECPLKRF